MGEVSASFLFSGREFYFWRKSCLKDMVSMACQFLPRRNCAISEMLKQRQLALSDPAEWLGDWHPLAEQLGSAEGLVELGSLSSLLQHPPVVNVATLRTFLRDYQAHILVPIELPAIRTAHGHVSRHEIRELIAFDQQLASQNDVGESGGQSYRQSEADAKGRNRDRLHRIYPVKEQRVAAAQDSLFIAKYLLQQPSLKRRGPGCRDAW